MMTHAELAEWYKPAKPFKEMSREEVSEWYVEHIGYDLGREDPRMTLGAYRKLAAEMYFLNTQV